MLKFESISGMKTLNRNSKKSLRYQFKAFVFAFEGLSAFFRLETKAIIHLFFALLAIGFGIVLNISTTEWITVILLVGLVFITELFNTAIERIIDHISPEYSEMAKLTKDLSAAAVLVAAFTAFILGLIIFLPKLIVLFQ